MIGCLGRCKSVSKWVESAFGVVYTAQGMVDLLNRIGFTYKKTKEVPCEAEADKQQQFAQELSVILQQKDTSSVVYSSVHHFRFL